MDLSFDCHGFLSNLHFLSLIASIVESLVAEVVGIYAALIAELTIFYNSHLLGYKAKGISDTYILIVGFLAVGIPLVLKIALQKTQQAADKNSN